MQKAVVFDMDGVLFDSERIVSEIWEELGFLDGIPKEKMQNAIINCIGRNHNDTGIYFRENFGTSFDYVNFRKKAADRFHKKVNQNGLPVKEGAYLILEYLLESDYKTALASSSSTKSIQKNLQRANMNHYFEVIVGGDTVEHSKPEPDIYIKACAELGVRPQDSIAIEDSPNGIKAAYFAGMKPIMVPDMVQPDKMIQTMLHQKFDTLINVMEYLQNLK